MKVYIITYKTEQQDTRIGAVYSTIEAAKEEVERLDSASSWGSAMLVVRDIEEKFDAPSTPVLP